MATVLRNLLESLQASWDNLNTREKQLVALLGGTFVSLALLLPLYLVWSQLTELQDTNEETVKILRELEKNSAELSLRAAEKKAALRRYNTQAPSLGGFLEEKARQVNLKLGDITEQPDKEFGSFVRRTTRVKLPDVGLRTMILWMAEIENSPYPMTIDYLRIEHYQSGDKYSAEVGVSAYERSKQKPNVDSASEPPGKESQP